MVLGTLVGRGKPVVSVSCKDSPCVQSGDFEVQKPWERLLFNLERSNYAEQAIPGPGDFPRICVLELFFSGFSDD